MPSAAANAGSRRGKAPAVNAPSSLPGAAAPAPRRLLSLSGAFSTTSRVAPTAKGARPVAPPPPPPPPATHAPALRSPKLGRIAFSTRSLVASSARPTAPYLATPVSGTSASSTRPASALSAARLARHVPASSDATAAAAAIACARVTSAAVREPLERAVIVSPTVSSASLVSPLPPIANGKDHALVVSPRTSHTPLSYLLGGHTAPVRESVVLTLDQLIRAPPPPPVKLEQYAGTGDMALVGLANIGNTCYMAAALQGLASVDVLANYLVRIDERDLNPYSDTKGQLALALAGLLREMHAARGAVSPRAFKREVERWAPHFQGYDQQDAQEFLRFLLDGLATDLARVRYLAHFAVAERDEDALPPHLKACVAWAKYQHRSASAVGDLFAGQLQSTITCLTCGQKSVTFDVFWDLSVPLVVRREPAEPGAGRNGVYGRPVLAPVALEDCLREFARDEELDPNEWYHCPRCQRRERSSKRLQVHRAPPVLVVHLKRFASLRAKLSVPVDFPVNHLDLSVAATAPVPATYKLVAVVQHYGSLAMGHYTATVRRAGDRWFKANDSTVMQVEPGNWATDAYVLFYQADPPWPPPPTPPLPPPLG
ncbi:hypothetical protein GGF31_001112 [Allomyces arbusculus]|nr:hypothetical protein GGF31_001112 [Allomyces arbusculus]